MPLFSGISFCFHLKLLVLAGIIVSVEYSEGLWTDNQLLSFVSIIVWRLAIKLYLGGSLANHHQNNFQHPIVCQVDIDLNPDGLYGSRLETNSVQADVWICWFFLSKGIKFSVGPAWPLDTSNMIVHSVSWWVGGRRADEVRGIVAMKVDTKLLEWVSFPDGCQHLIHQPSSTYAYMARPKLVTALASKYVDSVSAVPVNGFG